jgi:PTH2 family peptidyl-tRNA hydrolase
MSDEDKIVLYIVVRESLDMSPGKMGAQIGHAIDAFALRWHNMVVRSIYDKLDSRPINDATNNLLLDVDAWRKSGSTKIVLGANEKEWAKLLEEAGNNCFIITDAGRTEVEPGTQTVMCFWPRTKSSRSKSLKRLQILKD